MCGSRSRIASLDIDCENERVLADALSRHGKTPIIVRTGSGNYLAWYRHNGERRQIRPWPELPIDMLGGGFIVAPPSQVTKGQYQFIEGSLDDLERLPTLRNGSSPLQPAAPEMPALRQGGGRNDNCFGWSEERHAASTISNRCLITSALAIQSLQNP
jgi:Bifunctional DNA primase/polymerase, N-terminal